MKVFSFIEANIYFMNVSANGLKAICGCITRRYSTIYNNTSEKGEPDGAAGKPEEGHKTEGDQLPAKSC